MICRLILVTHLICKTGPFHVTPFVKHFRAIPFKVYAVPLRKIPWVGSPPWEALAFDSLVGVGTSWSREEGTSPSCWWAGGPCDKLSPLSLAQPSYPSGNFSTRARIASIQLQFGQRLQNQTRSRSVILYCKTYYSRYRTSPEYITMPFISHRLWDKLADIWVQIKRLTGSRGHAYRVDPLQVLKWGSVENMPSQKLFQFCAWPDAMEQCPLAS